MRSVDANARETCAFQADAFERSGQVLPHCSSAVFIRRFMRSRVARRVDENGAFDMGEDAEGVLRMVDAEYGSAAYGSTAYPQEVLYWIGYVYRYWCLATGLSSKRVYAACGAREMRGLYLAYHALDPAQCVERISEHKGLSTSGESDDELSRRVLDALRKRRGRGLVE